MGSAQTNWYSEEKDCDRERQSIARKGVGAIDPRKAAAGNGEFAAKASVRALRLSAD